jgi:hypothetical protein
MEELKRELLKDLKPLLDAQGIQFPDSVGVVSEEEYRSSLASTAGGGQPQGEIHVPVSRLIEAHEQPLSSLECRSSLILLIGESF